jgi:2-methylcitrate dehydratase
LLSLNFPECTKLLGPVVPGALGGPHGASVVGTAHELDPVTAAHNFATAIRWLDYNDAWCASEWVHPSDVVGAILPLSEYLSKVRMARHLPPLTMRDVVTATIKAYEIMGILATENSLNSIGVDGILFTRVAVAAVCARMLGGGRREVADAASQAFADGAGLRCFRHYPNVGPRKGWAAGDAASRGVWIALLTMRGERGHNLVLTAPVWGFNDVFFRKNDLRVRSAFKEHVAENVVFKVSFPAETHAQTAVEASFLLHPQVVHRVDEIHSVVIHTTRAAVRVIDKTGPLRNPADRDHCLRYAVAIGLLYGVLTAEHYEDAVASDPRVDELRERTTITENPQYSADYLDPDRRSVANAVQIHFRDRTSTSRVEIEYPLGHRRRRAEGFPCLEKKLVAALATRMPPTRAGRVFEMVSNPQRFDTMAVPDFVELFTPAPSPFLLPPIGTLRYGAAGVFLSDGAAARDERDFGRERFGGEDDGETRLGVLGPGTDRAPTSVGGLGYAATDTWETATAGHEPSDGKSALPRIEYPDR